MKEIMKGEYKNKNLEISSPNDNNIFIGRINLNAELD
jgi:hypothetical protein